MFLRVKVEWLAVPPTPASRRSVFRTIAQRLYAEWLAYTSTPLYDRSSLDALAADVRVVSRAWFTHKNHESLTEVVWSLPLACVTFGPHDRSGGSTRYKMERLFRVFVLNLLVQVQLTGEYNRPPLITADNTLTLLKKATGIG